MKRLGSLVASGIRAFLPLALCCAVTVMVLPFVRGADEKSDADVGGEQSGQETKASDNTVRIPLAAARDRAMLMQQMYTATLDVIHDKYFHSERAIVPARALEDVFEALEQANGSSAKWISVNLKAMSINHDPTTDFEKHAARALGEGKPEYESVESGMYRRATPILLNDGCLGCHAGFGSRPSKSQKLAGLVIAIPVLDDEPTRP